MAKNKWEQLNEELFYCACWRELQHFLSDLVIHDTVEEYPNARDFLALMASVERKMEG